MQLQQLLLQLEGLPLQLLAALQRGTVLLAQQTGALNAQGVELAFHLLEVGSGLGFGSGLFIGLGKLRQAQATAFVLRLAATQAFGLADRTLLLQLFAITPLPGGQIQIDTLIAAGLKVSLAIGGGAAGGDSVGVCAPARMRVFLKGSPWT